MYKIPLYFLLLFSLTLICCKNEKTVIYDEHQVPGYRLPELMLDGNGKTIKNQGQWERHRKGEIQKIYEKEVYGFFPKTPYEISFEETLISDSFLDNTALLKEVNAYVSTEHGKHHFLLLLVLPKSDKPVPLFTGLSFYGNHTIDTSSLITIHDSWVRKNEQKNIPGNKPTEASRGTSSERWPLKLIIDNGYGLCTAYYGDFDPDREDTYENGLRPLFAESRKPRDEHSSGSISIWAKGMSFMVDYLQTDTLVDEEKIIAIGHSRLGKTALWAAANDSRFAGVISNNSGCGGAALFRRRFGERIDIINGYFPHWFSDRFKIYNGKEKRLPVDQHMLLSLLAPRPLYIASASEDLWADPRGEFLALKAALPIYALYDIRPDFPQMQPKPGRPFHGITGYHVRSGKHNITPYDWEQYINWADKWIVRIQETNPR